MGSGPVNSVQRGREILELFAEAQTSFSFMVSAAEADWSARQVESARERSRRSYDKMRLQRGERYAQKLARSRARARSAYVPRITPLWKRAFLAARSAQ